MDHTDTLAARLILEATALHQIGVLALKPYTLTWAARPLAFMSRLSSGWPTSIQCSICPVRSRCHSAGSSVSHRSLASSSVPRWLSGVRFSTWASSRTIIRSSVSEGCRAIVVAWSA